MSFISVQLNNNIELLPSTTALGSEVMHEHKSWINTEDTQSTVSQKKEHLIAVMSIYHFKLNAQQKTATCSWVELRFALCTELYKLTCDRLSPYLRSILQMFHVSVTKMRAMWSAPDDRHFLPTTLICWMMMSSDFTWVMDKHATTTFCGMSLRLLVRPDSTGL